MPDLSATVVWELRRLDTFSVLLQGELIVETEGAAMQDGVVNRTGALVITDLRLLFPSTSLIRRRPRLFAISLLDVASVEATAPGKLGKDTGLLKVVTGPADTPYAVEFHLGGAPARAEEIRRSILQQQTFLAEGTTAAPRARLEAAEDEEKEIPVPVSLGRGVTDRVRASGGRLYVWGEPLGRGFDKVRAAFEAPAGIEFVRSETVDSFECYVQRGLRSPHGIHLTQRWWGLRPGISVDTVLGVLTGSGP